MSKDYEQSYTYITFTQPESVNSSCSSPHIRLFIPTFVGVNYHDAQGYHVRNEELLCFSCVLNEGALSCSIERWEVKVPFLEVCCD